MRHWVALTVPLALAAWVLLWAVAFDGIQEGDCVRVIQLGYGTSGPQRVTRERAKEVDCGPGAVAVVRTVDAARECPPGSRAVSSDGDVLCLRTP